MFKGFKAKYPEYEVQTPQTNKSFTLRTLNVQEEERLKTSLLTPGKISEHLNKCLYESLVSKPNDIKEYTDFLKKVTIKDRDAILFGLYHITYEEIRNYDITCGKCKQVNQVTIKASDTFKNNVYEGKDILTKRHSFELPVTKGVKVTLKQPTLFDELQAIKSAGLNASLDIVTETMIIDKFEEEDETSTEPTIYQERSEIVDAYLSLPSRDKNAINEAYFDVFGKYGVELQMKLICQHCMNEEVVDINLVDNFFRMVYTS